MSFSRYLKPSTFNITYTGPHQAISPEALGLSNNNDKLLHNNAGNLEWIGFNGANLPLKLDGSALISSQYLPSYVDDVMEYNSFASFPGVGETGKIYIDTSGSNKVYRWSGSSYFLVTDLSNYYTKGEMNTTTTTLQTNITNEATTRSSADSTLTTNLNSEITNRTNADTNLQNQINPLTIFKTAADLNFSLADASNFQIIRPLDMTTKAITNCPTITTITSNLSTEITNRTNADTTLQNQITPLTNFKTAGDLNFNLADATYFKIIRPLDMTTNAITNCPTITTINSNASTEVTNRTNADTNLQNQINTINTNAFFKNATGTTTIGSLIDCNGNSIINANIMHCGSLKTGSINTEAGTYIASVVTNGLDFAYGKNIYLDNNRSGRESNSCTISANFFDALDSLCITGKGNTPWAHDRRIYLQDIVNVRDQVNVPKLNTKTCDGSHRLTLPNIYTSTATVTGVNFFQYTAPAGYKMYSVQWLVATDPQFSGWTLSTDGTVTSINVSMTAGQQIRCIVLMCQD
jgi:hypothetical protein